MSQLNRKNRTVFYRHQHYDQRPERSRRLKRKLLKKNFARSELQLESRQTAALARSILSSRDVSLKPAVAQKRQPAAPSSRCSPMQQTRTGRTSNIHCKTALRRQKLQKGGTYGGSETEIVDGGLGMHPAGRAGNNPTRFFSMTHRVRPRLLLRTPWQVF